MATTPPPGILIPASNVTVKQNMNDSTPVQITFQQKRDATPLQPLLQASYANGILQFSAVVFLDANANIPAANISVYFDSNFTPPIFYICYFANDQPTSSYNIYTVNFNYAMADNPVTIQACVWDTDPKASRGTITTVQTVP